MRDLLVQLPALVGVLLGALASYLASSATERSRWHREREARWDERRLVAYEQYAHRIKKIVTVCVRVAGGRGLQSEPDPLSTPDGLAAMAVAEEERTLAWEAVLLLGSRDTIAAARGWHEACYALRVAAFDGDAGGWCSAVAAVSAARTAFYLAAKADLRMPVPDPDAYRWRLAPLGSPSVGGSGTPL